MPTAERMIVVSTKLPDNERGLVLAVAEADRISVSEAVRRLLVPAVRRRLTEIATGGGDEAQR